jgi:hypothetical protein
MNTYTWTIQSLNCVPQEDGKTNVVTSTNWTLSATDGIYISSAGGISNFTLNPTKSFTDFSNLTQEQVVGWVQEGLGNDVINSFKTSLDKQIANQVNPPTITPLLPWTGN